METRSVRQERWARQTLRTSPPMEVKNAILKLFVTESNETWQAHTRDIRGRPRREISSIMALWDVLGSFQVQLVTPWTPFKTSSFQTSWSQLPDFVDPIDCKPDVVQTPRNTSQKTISQAIHNQTRQPFHTQHAQTCKYTQKQVVT